MTDARPPTAGSADYIQNTTSQQASSDFNVSGNGTVGGNLIANGNVGIGTTMPAQKLEVAGNVKITGAGNGITFADGTTLKSTAGLEVGAGFFYLNIPGVGFQPRGSATSYTYDGVGCTSRSAGGDFFVAVVRLPEGAIVKSVRFYFHNNVAGNAGNMFFSSYDGIGTTTQYLSATSGATAGYGTVLSAEVTLTVDNASNTYALVWGPPANVNALCGARIAYHTQ